MVNEISVSGHTATASELFTSWPSFRAAAATSSDLHVDSIMLLWILPDLKNYIIVKRKQPNIEKSVIVHGYRRIWSLTIHNGLAGVDGF